MAKSVRSVERVIDILVHLNKHNGENSNQVANAINLSRGTVYRMLETLEKIGFVERHGDASGYWLTQKVLALSQGFDEEAQILNLAAPEIVRLGKSIVWPAMMAVPRGLDMEVRFTTDASTPLVFRRYSIGHTVPMLGSASGRCFLAFTSAARQDAMLELLAANAPAPWNALAANRTRVKRILNDILNKGFALADSPEGGTLSIAAPILRNGEPCAILATRYFKRSMTRVEATVRLQEPLCQTAKRIATRLEDAMAIRPAGAESRTI